MAANPSHITNCHLVVRQEEKADYLFDFNGGSVCVKLDGYLICPLEMFTKRQLNAATKKYLERQAIMDGDDRASS